MNNFYSILTSQKYHDSFRRDNENEHDRQHRHELERLRRTGRIAHAAEKKSK